MQLGSVTSVIRYVLSLYRNQSKIANGIAKTSTTVKKILPLEQKKSFYRSEKIHLEIRHLIFSIVLYIKALNEKRKVKISSDKFTINFRH